jgi:hypothetical protein
LQQRMLHPIWYPSQFFQGVELISYKPTPTTAWRIFIPTDQLIALVCWFHQVLGHPGIPRLRDLIATHFYHLQLWATVNDVIKHCEACQVNLQDLDMDIYHFMKRRLYLSKKLPLISLVHGELRFLKRPTNSMHSSA